MPRSNSRSRRRQDDDDDENEIADRKQPTKKQRTLSSQSASSTSNSKTKNQRSKDDDDDDDQGKALKRSKQQLELHINAAVPFIKGSFAAKHGVEACEWQWNSLDGTTFQENPGIVAVALSSGLPPQKNIKSTNKLLKDSDAVKQMIKACKNMGQVKELWDMLGGNVQKCPSLAFLAMSRGVPENDIGKDVIDDTDAVKKAVSDGSMKWKDMPTKYKKDTDLALAALERELGGKGTKTSLSVVLKKVTDKEKLWLEWACVHPECLDNAAIWRSAPQSVTLNREVMRKVVTMDRRVYEYLDPVFKDDVDFLTSILNGNINVMHEIRTETFRRFPSLLNKNFISKIMKIERNRNWSSSDAEFYTKIPTEMWNDRDFFLNQWIRGGGSLSGARTDFLDDEEIVLTHARCFYTSDERRPDRKLNYSGFSDSPLNQYKSLSYRLRSDRAFLEELVKVAPVCCAMVAVKNSPFRDDDDLKMIACSVDKFAYLYDYSHDEIQHFHRNLRKKIKEYNGFFVGILCGMKSNSGSSLALLDQGSDANIKRTIASFLDFPLGKNLVHLLRAGRHLGFVRDGFVRDGELRSTM
jgi:hypothetical protein